MKRIISVIAVILLMCSLLPIISSADNSNRIDRVNIQLDDPVASYCPDFTPVFNTDATVYYSVTWQENSPGFSAQLNSRDEFRAGLAYKVEIWIRLGDGNYLPVDGYGDLATAITVNGKAISSLKIKDRNDQNQITEVTITCEYDPLPGREISSVLITGIPTPVAGNMPIYSFTIGSSSYGFYHTEPVVWWDITTGKQMDSSDTFIQGHKYQLNIWLYANREGGFTFKTDSNGDPLVNAILNSWAADSVTTAYEQEGREVIDIRYTFAPCAAAHTCTPKLVPQQDPTCLLSGFKSYYACSCGKNFEDAAGKREITDMDGYGIIPALGHKEGSWGYNGTHHYKKCTTCNEVIPGTNAAHTGGTATCLEKGKCTVCGFAYLPENENHIPDSKWTACADLYHAHLCKLCGAHCDPEDHRWSPKYHPVDAKGHAYQCADCKWYDKSLPHNPGPAATEDVPQTCKDCGYIITPALNHTHKLTLVAEVAPTCMDPGTNAHYTCSGCSGLFKDENAKEAFASSDDLIIPPQGHKMSNDWEFDEKTHWRVCAVCDEKMIETDMDHEMKGSQCTTCEYGKKKPEETEPKETKPATSQDDSEPDDVQEEIAWWVILLIGLGCAAAGVVIGVVVMQHTKKKK